MQVPHGHARLPLTDADFLDFVYNYFKSEYAPIRSFWSTATAVPRNSERWINMGHELAPLSFRPANAQAQKDIESLDYQIRTRNLDALFIRGIVGRYAKYEVHERLEKKIYECCRLDLMVRKALKERHLINALWPSPAPRNINKDLLQQGVQVRQWYGDMFAKYFRYLHSVEEFGLRPDVDAKIKSSGTLMLVPFVEHLTCGDVDPIMPIVAKGAGYSNAAAWKYKKTSSAFGEPDRFEIRFDAPADLEDTHTRSVVRQCQCLKCGSKRDVTVVISIDPNPGPVRASTRQLAHPNTSAPRRNPSKTAQKYSQGYIMPHSQESTEARLVASQASLQQGPEQEDRSASPHQKKQCPRCTFLNHPDLVACEMCWGDLPEAALVIESPSPGAPKTQSSQSQPDSVPSPETSSNVEQGPPSSRPSATNRHSLSSTLFSIFPFNHQEQPKPKVHGPPKPLGPEMAEVSSKKLGGKKEESRVQTKARDKYTPKSQQGSSSRTAPMVPEETPNLVDVGDETRHQELSQSRAKTPPPAEPEAVESLLSQPPDLAMMPLTPPPTSEAQSSKRPIPVGLPQNLMDEYVPVSPAYVGEEEEEDAGWGEMSKEEASKDDSDEDEDGEMVGRREGMIDLDEVAREEMGVWGEREDEDNSDRG